MIFLWIFFAVAFLILAVGGYLFFRACGKVTPLPWLDREALEKTEYKKYADAIKRTHDYLTSHGAKDVWIQAKDGTLLHGLWLEAENAVGTVLLAHGYHSTYLVDFSGAIASYHGQGMNLLIPDQRCHGQSEGKYITFGVKESSDMLCWLEYLNRSLSDAPVVLSGMSMGAATVLYMADESLPGNVKGIIADCGFVSPAAIIGKVFTDVTHLPPVPWIYGAEVFARVLAGFSLWAKDSRKTLCNNTLPVFLVHGAEDDFVPCSMTKQAYEVCAGEKSLLIVSGAGHGVSYLHDKECYSAEVRKLLKKAFGEPYELRNNQKL